MSDPSRGATPPPSAVNTRPDSHEPPRVYLEPAILALPAVLNNLRRRGSASEDGEPVVAYADLRAGLKAAGYATDAAEWAIHRHVGAGRLVASPGWTGIPGVYQPGGHVFGGGSFRTHDRERCEIRATPALWAWWDESTRRSGSPLAALRAEADVRHEQARARAQEEGERSARRAALAAFRSQWVAAFDAWERIDIDARNSGWNWDRKLDECAARLLAIGALIRAWDGLSTPSASSDPDCPTPDSPLWVDRLRGAVARPDSPLEFRYAAGLLMLAADGDRGRLGNELRQLVLRRDLRPVSGWFPWFCDQVVPPYLGLSEPDGYYPVALAPLGPVGDENRALRALGLPECRRIPTGEAEEDRRSPERFATPNTGEETEPATPPRPTAEFLSARDLAVALGLGEQRNRVELALRRFWVGHPDCREEIPNPRRGEARYLYRVAMVWSFLVQRLSGWRVTNDDE